MEKNTEGRSLNYQDREDVWIINREYKPKQIKNKNELPKELLIKILQYSSKPGDLICDLFLGSFSTAKAAIGLNRYAVGFEKSKSAYNYQIKQVSKIKMGSLLSNLRKPLESYLFNQGKTWTDDEKEKIKIRYEELSNKVKTKKERLKILSKEYGRGFFSLTKLFK